MHVRAGSPRGRVDASEPHGGIYQRILARLSETEQQTLSALLQTNAEAHPSE